MNTYTQRVAKVATKFRLPKAARAALSSIPRAFSDQDRLRRADLKFQVMSETGCDDAAAEKAIEAAKRGKLIEINVGQHGYTRLRQ
jgi:hypothetical protein